jgi:hypothetical protein
MSALRSDISLIFGLSNLTVSRNPASSPNSGSQEVTDRPRNRQSRHRWKARLTERPNVPYPHLPPEEIGAHQRANRCGPGDQQKHLSGASKPIDLAALNHSSPCGQNHKKQLHALRKQLPVESLEKHRRIVAEVASTLQDQDVVKESWNTKDTDCQNHREEHGTAKPEDSSRAAPDNEAGRPGPAREREE